MRTLYGALCLIALAAPAFAQTTSRPVNKVAVTVTGTSATKLTANQRQYLAILNDSTADTVACNFGGTAVVNGAGSQTLPPLAGFVWDNGLIPSDAINCISSGTSTAVTILW